MIKPLHSLLNHVPKEKVVIELLGESTFHPKFFPSDKLVVYDRTQPQTIFSDCLKFKKLLYKKQKLENTLNQLNELIKEEKDKKMLISLKENKKTLEKIKENHYNMFHFNPFQPGKILNSIKIIFIAPIANIVAFDKEYCLDREIEEDTLSHYLEMKFINGLHQKILMNHGNIVCVSWEKYENIKMTPDIIEFLKRIKKYLDLLSLEYKNIQHIHFTYYSRDRYTLQMNQIKTFLNHIDFH